MSVQSISREQIALPDCQDVGTDLDSASAPTGIHGISDMPGHLIRRLHQVAVALFGESTAGFGITPVQYATMAAAARFPSIDQRSLADLVAFDASTIGDVIRRLERRGLLKRTPGITDRRVKHVELTRDGYALLEEIDPLIVQAQQALLAPLSSGEAAILMYLLRKLAALSDERSLASVHDLS